MSGYLLEGIRTKLAGFFTDETKTVNCPPFAESISEGDVRWEKGWKLHRAKTWKISNSFILTAVGDSVAEDETVAEIETDKTSIPIPSPTSGVIEQLLIEDGETVTPGTPLFTINTGQPR